MKRLLNAIIPAFFLLAAVLVCPGCGDTTTDEQEMRQMLEEAASASMNAKTYTARMSMNMEMDVTDETDNVKIDVLFNLDGTFDNANDKTYINVDGYMDMGLLGGKQELIGQVYIIDDYAYMKFQTAEAGDDWIKVSKNDENLDLFNIQMLQQEFEMLESPDNVEFIEYEEIDGKECAVIDLIPNDEYLREYASQQVNMSIELENLDDITGIYESMNYRIWIETDSNYVRKITMDVRIKFTEEQIELMEDFSGEIAAYVTGILSFSGYNTPVSIIIPEEAERAIDMTY